MAGYAIVTSAGAVARAGVASVTTPNITYMKGSPGTFSYTGTTLSGITAAATGKHRYDLVYLDTADNTAKIVTGTPDTPTNSADFLENLAPQPPNLPDGSILLAIICVDDAGIRAGDNGTYSVAGVADMRRQIAFGAHLVSYLSTPSEARGDLITRGASVWQRLATGAAGKFLLANGAGADLSWSDLLVSSFYIASQARGDIITRGSSAWQRLGAGSANYYLRSQGAANDLVWDNIKITSLYDAAEARGCLPMKGSTTWGVLAPGTAGQVLYSGGTGADAWWGYEAIQIRFGAGSGAAVVGTGIAPGSYVRAKANYTIVSWTLSEASATPISTTTVCDIVKKSSYPPAASDSICGATKPSLTAATTRDADTLAGWTTTINGNDWLALDIESNDNGKCFNLDLLVVRS